MNNDPGVTFMVGISLLLFHGALISTLQHSGQFEPLGRHSKKLGGIPFMGHFPSPNVFYTEFVGERRPAFMRNVLDHDDFPAYQLWTDSYISSRYGDELCVVEIGEYKDAGSRKQVNMALRDFLYKYKKEDMCLVNDVPDPMKAYVRVPSSLECGGYLRGLQHVVMWFSYHGTRSHLHKESLDNMYCLLDGTKRILLIDKIYSHLVEADGWMDPGGYSLVDPERVDLDKFPRLKDILLYEIILNKGDCLFVPERWYHYDHSPAGTRTLVLTFFFHHLHWFNHTDCEGKDPSEKSSISLGKIRFGRESDQQRMNFLDLFGDLTAVSREQFMTSIQDRLPETLTDKQRDSISKVFTYADKDSNGELSWEELYLMDIEEITEYLSDGFSDVDIIYFPRVKETEQSEEKHNESGTNKIEGQPSSGEESCTKADVVEDSVQKEEMSDQKLTYISGELKEETSDQTLTYISGEQELDPVMDDFHRDDVDIVLESGKYQESQNVEDHDEL